LEKETPLKLFKVTVQRMAAMTITLAMIAGCGGNLGASYVRAVAPNDRGTVYVYRPAMHTRSALNFAVTIGDASPTSTGQGILIGMLENNGYIPVSALGPTRITFVYAKKSVDLNVEAGKSYYVRIKAAPNLFDSPENGTIEIVDEGVASPEIAAARIQENTYRGK
jgi:hypothetical protein